MERLLETRIGKHLREKLISKNREIKKRLSIICLVSWISVGIVGVRKSQLKATRSVLLKYRKITLGFDHF